MKVLSQELAKALACAYLDVNIRPASELVYNMREGIRNAILAEFGSEELAEFDREVDDAISAKDTKLTMDPRLMGAFNARKGEP